MIFVLGLDIVLIGKVEIYAITCKQQNLQYICVDFIKSDIVADNEDRG